MTAGRRYSSGMPGPQSILRFPLKNGATMLFMENPDSIAVSLVGLIRASSRNDPPAKLGLADFTADMLTRGTAHRNFHQIHDQLESSGASLSFSSSAQNIWFSGKCLAEDLPMLLELSADCLMAPEFPAEYVERMRSQILSALAIRDQDTADQASLALDKILFPNHPLGNPSEGFPDTVRAIQRQDLQQFHQDFFGPDGMLLVIVGGIQPARVKDLTEKYFEGWKHVPRSASPLPQVSALDNMVRQHIEIPGKNQTDLLLGSLAPARTSVHFLPVYLGNDILGQFGMLGRIGESVRNKAGLAYYAGSSVNSWLDGGDWEFMAGVNPANTEKAVELIIKEIELFIAEPVTAEELSDSKSHLSGRLALSLESNAGLANAILTMEHFNLGLDYYQRYSGMLDLVTAEQILKSSRQFLNAEKLAVVSAGTTPGK